MKIFLATWAEDNQGRAMSLVGCKHRLMSYYFLSKERESFTKEYVLQGAVIKKELKDENRDQEVAKSTFHRKTRFGQKGDR
jgi:hypothetical protein